MQVINTNVAALFSARAMNKSHRDLMTAMQRLSSGVRLNTGADDPTALSSSSVLQAQLGGAQQAQLLSGNAVVAAQTNDGYLSQILTNDYRLRDIAVELGGTATGSEATALINENSRITGLMNAATTNIVVNQSGGTQATTGKAIGATAGTTVANYDTDILSAVAARAAYGADMATFISVTNNLQTQAVNLAAQLSSVQDTDYAVETGNMTKNQILQQAGSAMLAQANQATQGVMALLR
jgi:flagellin